MKIMNIIGMLCLHLTLQAMHENPITITIWVHGTRTGPRFIMHDFFYRKCGMVNANDYHPKYHFRDIAHYLCNADPINYQFDHFYFWGWSGTLSRRARYAEARPFYLEILKLRDEYQQKYPDRSIRIRLMSHSHGGNHLLNVSQVQDPDKPLIIDEVVLLSCPVQYATKEYVKSPYFKKIYSFYSSDLYQVIDFQRTIKDGCFIKKHSNRRFEESPHLHQTKVKINGRFLFHIEFLLNRFLKHIPGLCQEIDLFYAELNPVEQKRPKLLHIHTCRSGTTIRRKLF